MKKLNTRNISSYKLINNTRPLQMLTCYDYQTAGLLNETELDMILVGDSLGNVILGYDNTIAVSLDEMKVFCSAVKRGAPNKFIVGDMPFGSYSTVETGLKNAIDLFQTTLVESIKMEGSSETVIELVKKLGDVGIPVMGHIGLIPQSVHKLGGYYTHGKDDLSAKKLMEAAFKLQDAGAFAIVLECVEKNLAKQITDSLDIPTIGIGAGTETDGQVLVLNDLLKMGADKPPQFCKPIADLYSLKKSLIEDYLNQTREKYSEQASQ